MVRSKFRPMREPGRKWTADENTLLLNLGRAAENCYVNECDEVWRDIGRLLERSPKACRTRYSKLKHKRIKLP